MQVVADMIDEAGRQIVVTVTYKLAGDGFAWRAVFAGSDRTPGVLAGVARSESGVLGAVQATILQAGVRVRVGNPI